MRTLEGELVGPGDKGEAGEFRDLGRDDFRKSRRRIDSGPDRRTAERKLINAFDRIFDPLEIIAQHGRMA